MKVGIITYSFGQNYGALLQAYASKEYIKGLGYDAEIINYRRFDKRALKPRKYLKDIFATLILLPQNFKRIQRYLIFRQQFLQLGELVDSEEDLQRQNEYYKVFITGSDQVWNCSNGANPDFFLRFVSENNIKMSYAPSFGTDWIPKSMHEQVACYLKDFSYISVREKSGIKIVEDLLGIKPEPVLDPVFLLDKYRWDMVCSNTKSDKEFIFVYTTQPSETFNMVLQKASKYFGIPIISTHAIPGCKCSVKKDIGPREFISYIKNAKYVITTSFHACVFSIIYNKQFWVVPHSVTGARVKDLLSDLHLETALIETDSVDFKPVVYSNEFEEIFKEKIENSRRYLQVSLLKADEEKVCD